jgi:hypothetical protein|tara:strand:+ start:149 stop:394 length:246 start_codon:yes stop_codon:yes gene_type:complete
LQKDLNPHLPRCYDKGTKHAEKNTYYRPRHHGSNYAILITLLNNEEGRLAGEAVANAAMTKDQIFDAADYNFNHYGTRHFY